LILCYTVFVDSSIYGAVIRHSTYSEMNFCSGLRHLNLNGSKINATDEIALEAERGIVELEAFLADKVLVAA